MKQTLERNGVKAIATADWMAPCQSGIFETLTGHAGIDRSLGYLRGNYCRPIQLKHLVKVSSMSRRGYFKAFQKHVGVNPGMFLRSLRIQHASQLLMEQDFDLKQIAPLCGFRSVNTFCVAFQREKGMSPKRFQRQYLLSVCRTYRQAGHRGVSSIHGNSPKLIDNISNLLPHTKRILTREPYLRKHEFMCKHTNQIIFAVLLLISICTVPSGKGSPTELPTTKSDDAKLPGAKENFHIYLLMGQSNMAGRDTRTLTSQVDNPHVLALGTNGQWIIARDPIHTKVGRIEPGAGPGIPFALEMLKTETNLTIGLIPCAVGGTPLSRWVKGGDLYEKAMYQAKLTASAGVIKGVLWHQGESDSTKQQNATTYAARLAQMIRDFRAELGQTNLPIVVGQLGEFLEPEKYPYAETVRSAIRSVSTNLPNVGYAASNGLGDKGDKLHFSAESQKQMGIRFAHAMQKLQPTRP